MITPLVADMNHNNSVDFDKLAAAGCVGVILKARQGTGFVDPAFHARRDTAKKAGLLVGAYDFATHDDPVENAKAFLETTGVDSALSYWLDFEDNTKSQMSGEQAAIFLDAVAQAIGRPCGIYGGNRIFEEIDDTDQQDVDWWAQHPLWLCQYKTDPALKQASLAELKPHIRIPSQWKKPGWFLLQYTGDGIGPLPHSMPGLEQGADLNAFDGTPEQLRAVWATKGAANV